MSDKNTDKYDKVMKKVIDDLPGDVESISFVSEDGTIAATYEGEKEEVSNVVQMTPKQFVDTANDLKNDGPAKDARWHRREARRLLVGKPGLTDEQKIERMQRAQAHLEQAIALTAPKA